MEGNTSPSEIIRKNKKEILVDWEGRVRKQVFPAKKEGHVALIDHIPVFLDEIAQALEDHNLRESKEIVIFAHRHGAERALFSDYTVEDALNEYNILRKVIFTFIDRSMRIENGDRDIILDAINYAKTKAVSEYAKLQINELKRSEQLTRESQERFKALADSVPQLVWTAKPDGTVDYYNNKVHLYEGAKKVDDHYEWEALVHPEDEVETVRAWNDAIATGTEYRVEHRVKMTTGKFRWHLSRAVPLKNEFGQVTRWYGTATDIHQMKEAEAAQVKATEDIKRIADIQTTLIAYVNKDLTYKFANYSYKCWFDNRCREIAGLHMKELLGDEAFSIILPNLERALAGKKEEFDLWFPYRGTDKFVHVIYQPDFSLEGDVQGLFISVNDLTEFKIMVETLKTSELQFTSLANSIPQLAWMAHPDGSIFWYNQRWYDYTGSEQADITGNGWHRVHHPDYIERVKEKYLKHIHEGTIWEDTFPLKRKDGKWRWFLSRAMPIKDENGEITRWFGTNTDITEHKELVDSLHEEQGLRDKFISTLSHDLRTPLTAAKISAQLIGRKTTEDSSRATALRINENLTRIDKMVQDLLDASRIRAGKLTLPDIQKLDVVDVVEDTLETLSQIHGDRFKLKAPQSLEAQLDPESVRRIMENLVNNAIKYGSQYDPVTVTLSSEGECVLIHVENKGNPLINVDKKKLFEPFQQGSAAEIAGKKGWGIGLTIVKGLTEAHGGSVAVESDEKGTIFKIKIPKDSRKAAEEKTELH